MFNILSSASIHFVQNNLLGHFALYGRHLNDKETKYGGSQIVTVLRADEDEVSRYTLVH